MKRIYLDYAASTPVDPRVFRAMEPYFGAGTSAGVGQFGNPGSLHSFGQAAIAALDHARETVARSIGAEFREIIFTSSATEANNLALQGVIQKAKAGTKVIISSIEHESIIETARDLERAGVEVVYVAVDCSGVIDLEKLKESLDERTVLVSIMHANNEIGTIQPIAEIAKIIAEFKKEKSKQGTAPLYPLFHTDAAQSFQFLECDVRELGVDLMTLSSHKIYGPKGSAALYIKGNGNVKPKSRSNQSPVEPTILGGGQEYGLRSGTENVPAIVGFAKAVELADAARKKEAKRIADLKNKLWLGIKKIYPKAERSGGAKESLPSILNIYFPGRAAQDLLTRFDLAGLAASSGSACRSRAAESSYVIEALGYSKERAKSSIRFSLGKPTTKAEITAALRVIKATAASA